MSKADDGAWDGEFHDDERRFASLSGQERMAITARFWGVAGRFWHGATAGKAWFYTLGLGLGLLAALAVNIGINRWQSAIFNALEMKDGARVLFIACLVPLLVMGGSAAGALTVSTRETLQAFWRQFVVERMVARWVKGDRYRAIQESGAEPPHPEFRIADDVRLALDPLVDFAIGFFSAGLTMLAFIGILWGIGGALTLPFAGGSVVVPAYMVIAAVLYGLTMTLLTVKAGHPLVEAVVRRNESEARLRFDLTHLREHAERVRAAQEADAAHGRILSTYGGVLARTRRMIRYHTRITWFTNGNGVLVPIFAIVLAAPKYLAGELSLGDVVSLGAAFHQTQTAFAWLVDNFRQVATWYASVGRVVDLIDALPEAGEGGTSPPVAVPQTETAPG